MTIYEQLIDCFQGLSGRLVSTSEIKRALHELHETNPASVLPSDYCYNRLNQGMQDPRALFVRVGWGEYRYLGLDHPYSGLVYGRGRGEAEDRVVGERVDGELRALEERPKDLLPMSRNQLERLYEKYMEILDLEVAGLGCEPTQTTHLVGRLGELACARMTRGNLARRVNQHGFDVVAPDGRCISVKSTAQASGFVSLNANTIDLADDLMVLRYHDGQFELVYYGEVAPAVHAARQWNSRYELELSIARSLEQRHGLPPTWP